MSNHPLESVPNLDNVSGTTQQLIPDNQPSQTPDHMQNLQAAVQPHGLMGAGEEVGCGITSNPIQT